MTGENEGPVAIDLAHEADFALGALTVSPSTREVLRGALREQLEPRVMQVLVALAQADGKVVSRDDLIARCWEGRVVGEDAINRAIGRLRRLSEADKGASFEIETIPRVGYRLVAAGSEPAPSPVPAVQQSLPHSRRWLVSGGAALLVGAGAGYFLLRKPQAAPPAAPPDAIAEQVALGVQLLRQATVASCTEALALFETLTVKYPGVADSWGGLAFSYALLAHSQRKSPDALRLRSNAAADRALALDPHNAMAFEARGWSFPRRGAWQASERCFREGLQYHPKHDGLLLDLAFRLADVGRNGEAADYVRRAADNAPSLDSALAWNSIQIFWSANRLAEADEAAERARQMLPRNTSSWFWQVYLLMFTGRAEAALTKLNDIENRPNGIPQDNFDIEIAVAQALQSRKPDDIAVAEKRVMDFAHQGGGYAENALMLLPALGRIDQAFAVADGYFFGRGFQVGERRFSATQGGYAPRAEARTMELFTPAAKPMRADPRFAKLVDELGLVKYWKDAGVVPDYQRA